MTTKNYGTQPSASTPASTAVAFHAGAAEHDKAFATLAAEFALAGHALMRNERGSLFAMRWGQIKPLADLGEAKRFLAQIGGRL